MKAIKILMCMALVAFLAACNGSDDSGGGKKKDKERRSLDMKAVKKLTEKINNNQELSEEEISQSIDLLYAIMIDQEKIMSRFKSWKEYNRWCESEEVREQGNAFDVLYIYISNTDLSEKNLKKFRQMEQYIEETGPRVREKMEKWDDEKEGAVLDLSDWDEVMGQPDSSYGYDYDGYQRVETVREPAYDEGWGSSNSDWGSSYDDDWDSSKPHQGDVGDEYPYQMESAGEIDLEEGWE